MEKDLSISNISSENSENNNIFSPDSSSFFQSKNIISDFDYSFQTKDILRSSMNSQISNEETEMESKLFSEIIETINDSVQLNLENVSDNDDESAEILGILKRPITTKAKTNNITISKPRKISMAGRVVFSNVNQTLNMKNINSKK